MTLVEEGRPLFSPDDMASQSSVTHVPAPFLPRATSGSRGVLDYPKQEPTVMVN